jgi:bacteriocin-like protein
MKVLSLKKLKAISGGDGEGYCYGSPNENAEEQWVELAIEKVERA